MSARSGERWPVWFAAIFATALAVRAGVLLEVADTHLVRALVGDAALFDAWGAGLAAGTWEAGQQGREVFFLAPLYPYFLAGVYEVFGHAPLAARWVQAVLGASSAVFLTLAARRLFAPSVARVAGFFLALYAPAVWFDVLIQKTCLATFLTTLFLACFAAHMTRPRLGSLLGAGLALGALALTRENAAILLPVAALWLLFGRPGGARPRLLGRDGAGLRLALLVLAFSLPLLPFALRNRALSGELTTTSNSGVNFYLGNGPGADGLYRPLLAGRGRPDFEREDATRLAQAAAGRELTPLEVSGYWWRRTLDRISDDVPGWLALLGRKQLLLLQADEAMDSEDLGSFADHSLVLRVLARALHFGVLLPLAAVGLWSTRARWRELWFLHAALLAVAGSVTLFFVVARFRFTLALLLVPFAGAGLLDLGGRLRERRRLLAPLALVAGAAVLSTLAGPPPGDPRARTASNYGAALLDQGRHVEAVALLVQAVEREPDLADARFNLGAAFGAAGEPERAEEQYLAAVRLQPEYAAAAYGRLGELHALHGTPAAAQVWFERARNAAPDEARTHFNLAYHQGSLGDTRAAARGYREALARDPDFLPALRELAYVLAAHPGADLRDGGLSVRLSEHAVQLFGEDPLLLDLLAMGRAETGDFEQAVRTAERALALAEEAGLAEHAEGLRRRLALYRAGQPYRGS